MPLTIEKLYEAYMDIEEFAPGEGGVGRDFALDIWDFFAPDDPRLKEEQFQKDYGMYLPTYDPAKEHLAFEDKALSFIDAANTYSISKAATDRVYSEEMKEVSGGLEEEMAKGREIAGGIGLRSGTLESALEGTMTSATNRARNLGDRLDIQKDKDLDAYNLKMSDAALDYEKDIYENKEAFYDRVMAAVARLTDKGAFDLRCPDPSLPLWCESSASCVAKSDECTTIDYDPGPGNQFTEFDADPTGYCGNLCGGLEGFVTVGIDGGGGGGGVPGGLSCPDACTATMGGGTQFDTRLFDWQDRMEAQAGECDGGWVWESGFGGAEGNWVCESLTGGDEYIEYDVCERWIGIHIDQQTGQCVDVHRNNQEQGGPYTECCS